MPFVVIKNQRRVIVGWAFFDWANSAFALVITAAIFPGYFLQVTNDEIAIGSFRMSNSTLYSWSIALAYLLIAAVSPLLSGIADYGNRRKAFLRFFTTVGSMACISLLFFRGMDTLWVGVTGFVLAMIGFAGGIVFYNSFLPLIATEERYDSVSALGFSLGFFGSVILLVINLAVITFYDTFGFSEALKAVPVAFVMVGLWWLGFAQIPLRRLPKDQPTADRLRPLMRKGYAEIARIWRYVKSDRNMLRYLAAFFAFNAGVNAVLYIAAIFAEKELRFSTSGLIILILILQLVAIVGATLSTMLSKRKGNKWTLMLQLSLWLIVCAGGYFVQTGLDFYVLACMVGMVMGGVQALARSTYAKLLPEGTTDTASFFSFYDVMDKLSTVAGTFVFGLVEQITGGMRDSVLAMAVFFLAGMILLSGFRVQKKTA
ncbi:MAG: MFS transporter [Saprospiraceae bacterium]